MKAIKEDPIAEILKKIAPGTPIREGLDNISKNGWCNNIKRRYEKNIICKCTINTIISNTNSWNRNETQNCRKNSKTNRRISYKYISKKKYNNNF